MIRCLPIPSCAACPFMERHYGNHECRRMEFKQLPKQANENGRNTPIPNWCPLPLHPTANEVSV